jgi:broad specificity phosphatase PhoE
MKPEHIILIRHGQSEGNVDKKIYNKKPDHVINLTKLGEMQALAAGGELVKKYPAKRMALYSSTFKRARQTSAIIRGVFESAGVEVDYREDPRLREQEWATCMRAEEKAQEEKEREEFSKFYYRFKTGESCADMYDGRISTLLDTFHRDFEKDDFPPLMCISGHGMTNRVLLMRWFHISVEDFERIKNPANCEYYTLTLQSNGYYKLERELDMWSTRETIYF